MTCPADTTKEHQSQDCPHLASGFSLWALHHHTRLPLWGWLTLKYCGPRGIEQPGEGVYTPLLSKVNSPFLFVFCKQKRMNSLRPWVHIRNTCEHLVIWKLWFVLWQFDRGAYVFLFRLLKAGRDLILKSTSFIWNSEKLFWEFLLLFFKKTRLRLPACKRTSI